MKIKPEILKQLIANTKTNPSSRQSRAIKTCEGVPEDTTYLPDGTINPEYIQFINEGRQAYRENK
jgi:hypothetical protein